MNITNQDWKLFRQRLPGWQEAYMDRLNKEYADILFGEGQPSEKFWALENRIREDRRRPGVQLRISRSTMLHSLILLLHDGVITTDDLEGFSDDVKKSAHMFLNLNQEK